MTTTTPVSAPGPTRGASQDPFARLLGRCLLTAGVLGLVLGDGCRRVLEGAAGDLGSIYASFGAPWIGVAFLAGAIVAVRHPTETVTEVAGVVLGGVAGAASLVIASVTYYGDASSTSAVFWSTVGVVVGGLAGMAGAAWHLRPNGAVGALTAGGLGVALVAEAVARLSGGWWLGSDGVSRLAGWSLVVAGLLVPVLLLRGRLAGWAAALCALLLAAPVATFVIALSTSRLLSLSQ